jgi:hypothetical protein
MNKYNKPSEENDYVPFGVYLAALATVVFIVFMALLIISVVYAISSMK